MDCLFRESFTIHGLWPSGTGPRVNQFNVKYIERVPSLYADLRNFMPPQPNSRKTESPFFLWNHQYRKHGRDYVAILRAKDPATYRNASDEILQVAYFQATIDFYRNHKL